MERQDGIETIRRQAVECGAAGQVFAEPPDGVFHPALLPGGMGIAKERVQSQLAGDVVMAIELGAIIEGDGTTQGLGHRLEQGDERGGDRLGPQAVVTQRQGEPGMALMHDQDGLTGLRK
ncbi:MAG: hypothetical protein ABS76_11475 [Pelagibacterium sp. SCN 64-44]|nr:MAG: hypothetical protein ABS76_11475 [Pelagibacterium sp. SCN 64-44]